MGILGGLKLKKRQRRVVVGLDESGEAVELIVTAPPLQLMDRLDASLPTPAPPIMKDARGNPVPERDENDNIVTRFGSTVFQRDYMDRAYLRRVDERDQAMTIGMIVKCLGDQLKPTTTPEQHDGDMVRYYQAVWGELEAAGLDVGSFKALSAAAVGLGQPLSQEEADDAKESLGIETEENEDGKQGNA